MGFIALKVVIFFHRKHYVVTDGIMTLRASNQVLCNMWSYDFYVMTLATEKQRRHMIKPHIQLGDRFCIQFVPFFLYTRPEFP